MKIPAKIKTSVSILMSSNGFTRKGTSLRFTKEKLFICVRAAMPHKGRIPSLFIGYSHPTLGHGETSLPYFEDNWKKGDEKEFQLFMRTLSQLVPLAP